MKRLGALVAASALLLSGCGGAIEEEFGGPETDTTEPTEPERGYTELEDGYRAALFEASIELSDGRKVTCIVARMDRGGGPDCDWAGAKHPATPEGTPDETGAP